MLAMSFVLTSCYRNHGALLRDQTISGPHESGIKSTLVFLISGDGSYTDHHQAAKRLEADGGILKQAIAFAKNSSHAEVFIFHQKPKRKWLFLFSRPDGSFHYFRNGQRLANGSYHRRSKLDSENEIFGNYHARGSEERVFGFLYFGHALEEGSDQRLRQSMNVDELAQGMSCLLSEVDPNLMKFDLVVLSACYSGTPGIVAELAPYSRYILASPDELHLAYMDIQPLRGMSEIGLLEVHSLAREMASRSLARLREWTQTAITLTVYDIERIAPFLQEVLDRQRVVRENQAQGSPQPVTVEYYDCFEESPEIPAVGVEVYYQPPRFGRLKNKTKHSGWTCWEIRSK